MSLDVSITYKKPLKTNYFLNHPYSYNYLTENDLKTSHIENYWSANITHDLNTMAKHVPVSFLDSNKQVQNTTLYMICWYPEKLNLNTTSDILDPLEEGILYMIKNRLRLLEYNPANGWGNYNNFMKFLLNYKQACEDHLDCQISVSR